MQKLQSIQTSPTKDQNITLDTRHMLMSVWYNAWAIRPSGWPWMEKPSTWKSFVSSSRSIFIYNSSQSEVIWDLGRPIKIRLCFWSSENSPVEWKPTFRVRTYQSSEKLLFEWKLTSRVKVWHPSELIIIWVKILPSEWKLADRVRDYLPSENIVIRVKRSSRVKDSNIRVDELKSEWNWTCAQKFIKMISDGKVFNTEVVRIIKTINFGFGVIVVRDSI